MLNQDLKNEVVSRVLPRVRTPPSTSGASSTASSRTTVGAWNRVPGVSRHLFARNEPPRSSGAVQPDERGGLGVRASVHAIARFRVGAQEAGLPLYSLETFTPLCRFDVAGLFAPVRDLLHERADDARPRGDRASRRGSRPRRHAGDRGRPGAQNPELLAPFIDLFVIGDGEPSLPVVCDLWKSMQGSGLSREEKLRESPAASSGPTSRDSTSRSTRRTARSSRSAARATTCPKRSSRA